MSNRFLTGEELPFCKGCGHTGIAEHTEKALLSLGWSPLDVVLVSDIGCHGIVDRFFTTHTVHGLHGRSIALASGITAGLNDPSKKVVVFLGDGGATIGMQHLIDAAHNNFNMTLVIHNNFLYGMTGGQPSELTPLGFKTPTLPMGASTGGYDICELATAAGANYVVRVMGIGDFSEALSVAFSKSGLSVIEVLEVCPSYGMKANPGMKLRQVAEEAGIEVKVYADRERKAFNPLSLNSGGPLFEPSDCLPVIFSSEIDKPVQIMLAGSAGEGVQAAADFFAQAAVTAGLNVTKKGSYPVTVGVGYSASELIVSPQPIFYTGSPSPDTLIILSGDGLSFARNTASRMTKGEILIDDSLPCPEMAVPVIPIGFRTHAGPRNAAFYALFRYLDHSRIFPAEALKKVIGESKLGEKINLEKLFQLP
ncbi:MAG: 2-oxoacid:acceptor oxidoreductase family protein [Bacteroidales bacterium]|nr:2-oxoacid:acceptor oxidoreductase family protein [Bacteroidales bacterium]